MLDILREHLNMTETTEFIGMIEEAHRLFDRFNLPDYDVQFIDLIQCIDQYDAPSQEIYTLTRSNQLTILRMHGIIIDPTSEKATITFLSKILTAILLFEDTEQVDEIDSIVTNTPDPEECVAAIFNQIDPSINPEEMMLVMSTVVHALPERILERVKQNAVEKVVAAEERVTKEYQDFIKKAVEFLGVTHVLAMAKMYTKILDFKEYVPIIEDLVPEDPENINKDAYAREILTAAVISNAGNGNYMAVIKEYLDEEDFPIRIHTEILVLIDSLNNQLAVFKTKSN